MHLYVSMLLVNLVSSWSFSVIRSYQYPQKGVEHRKDLGFTQCMDAIINRLEWRWVKNGCSFEALKVNSKAYPPIHFRRQKNRAPPFGLRWPDDTSVDLVVDLLPYLFEIFKNSAIKRHVERLGVRL